MSIIVKIDGRDLSTIPEDIARNDDLLRAALEPFYPEIRSATFARAEVEGTLTITVVKRNGPKGALLDNLRALPETIHPALLLTWDLQHRERQGVLSLPVQLDMHRDIEAAIAAVEVDTQRATATLKALRAAAPTFAAHRSHL